ncbi:MAG TPA: rRNA adenine N-6-methyltransferase family protein, partial [Planctomycetaceae bacterium]|nr:rRNA adenine N-6-methyltransferase family protein [Planctomycetaceae bacterium]
FWPRPQVDSAIVQIVPAPERREQIGDRAFFHDFIRRLFQQRRKFLRSVLGSMYRKELTRSEIDSLLEPLQLKDSGRAEELDVAKLVEIARAVELRLREKV